MLKTYNLEKTAALLFEKYVVETILERCQSSNFCPSVKFSGSLVWSLLPDKVKAKDHYLEQCQTQGSAKKIRGFLKNIAPDSNWWTVEGLKTQNAFDAYDREKGDHNKRLLSEVLEKIKKELEEELTLF